VRSSAHLLMIAALDPREVRICFCLRIAHQIRSRPECTITAPAETADDLPQLLWRFTLLRRLTSTDAEWQRPPRFRPSPNGINPKPRNDTMMWGTRSRTRCLDARSGSSARRQSLDSCLGPGPVCGGGRARRVWPALGIGVGWLTGRWCCTVNLEYLPPGCVPATRDAEIAAVAHSIKPHQSSLALYFSLPDPAGNSTSPRQGWPFRPHGM
jgi:hypothetical protein